MKQFSFIYGQLIRNDIGAIYEGHIWNRWLKVRISDEFDIDIFDENNISASLLIGNYYDFIITPLLGDVNLSINNDKHQNVDLICENWTYADNEYMICRSQSLVNQTWCILHTPLGCVLLHKSSLQYAIQLSHDKYEIVIARWDLEGVKSKSLSYC